MENGYTLKKDFGVVACGQKNIDILKIENTSNKAHTLVVTCNDNILGFSNKRLRIHPTQAVAQPGQSARFTLTYLSFLEDIIDNFYCNVLENEKLIARLNVRAQSIGPCLTPTVFNLKFFHFHNVCQTVKRIEIANAVRCEAKFYFDLDEDYQHLEISPVQGVIPPGLKLGLRVTFKPLEPGIYYKRVFCIVQFHKPIIFNILGVYKPKLKLEPKQIKFRFPSEQHFCNNYAAYMAKMIPVTIPDGDKSQFHFKCVEEHENVISEEVEESESEKKCWSVLLDSSSESESQSNDNIPPQISLTTSFIDINNTSEVLGATTLINFSKTQLFYFEWDHDPKNHFRMDPCNGFIKPNAKINFSIYFTPSVLDLLYHIELDLKVFPCSNEPDKNESLQTIDLPLTMSLRINGHSFPDDSCGWIPQFRLSQKTIHLPACVPDDIVYGTFMLERERHLPMIFTVITPKDSNFVVQPPLGYLSKSFQLFVVQFNSESKEPGVYTEELVIRFNNSNLNNETIRLVTSVEIPTLIFGNNNSFTFTPIFPGSRTSAIVPIENPTNLFLSYEFVVPEDISWAEMVNPKGSIEPKSFSEIEVIFKPEATCEYLDYIPCYVSCMSKPDFTVTLHLQLIGSCQFGYLIATPSIHDFGESVYLQEKSTNFHLFNFSSSLIYFRLKAVHRAFPVGKPQNDVRITPDRGSVPAKGSLEVKVTIIPNEIDIIQYAIVCQNYDCDLEEASPQDEPKKIFLFRFEGVLPGMQVVDLKVMKSGPLFSSHCLWKMMNLDRLNKSLKSVSPYEEVIVRFPDTVLGSRPIVVALLLEANRHGNLKWRFKQQIVCPCLEASDVNVFQTPQCKHVKNGGVESSQVLGAKEKLMIEIIFKYEAFTECTYEWTLEVPHRRKIVLKALIVASPNYDLPLNSMYLNPHFLFKPVFIGDRQPLLQLFWLYNNTNQPTSYFVESITLKEFSIDAEHIFSCINPKGIIPPISSIVLGFLFKPLELKYYSANVQINIHGGDCKSIDLIGEGTAKTQYFQEFFIPKTLPKKPILVSVETDVKCTENFIDVPYFRMFSFTKRVFLLRNCSMTDAWSFRWHSFNAPDIVSVKIEPSEGVIQPKSTALMIITMKSYSYPTFISFSVPCDVINYSKLKAYESSVRYRQKMSEKVQDYFTITEKGMSYEKPVISIKVKPEPAHIFITVNANIVSGLSIDEKLPLQRQMKLIAGAEITSNFNGKTKFHPSTLPSIQHVLENLIWEALVSSNVKENIKKLQTSQDYNYLQILPESKKKCEENFQRFSARPSKHYIQKLMQNTINEILSQNFCPEKNQQSS